MALPVQMSMTCLTKCLTEKTHFKTSPICLPILSFGPRRLGLSISSSFKFSLFKSRQNSSQINTSIRASKAFDLVRGNNYEEDSDTDTDSDNDSDLESPLLTDKRAREEMRGKIREMLDQVPPVSIETDEEMRKQKINSLLKDYNLVVDEEDPDWPEEHDEGWGFNLDQFFNKIQIKNNERDDDDEGYDSQEDVEWKDDDYIKPIKEVTAKEWEATVFIDFNPLVILVHNRYRRCTGVYRINILQVVTKVFKYMLTSERAGKAPVLARKPKENEKARTEIVKAIEMFWQSGLPSPRCVGIDAFVEDELVKALKITNYPEIIFTKNGKILHRDIGVVRTAQEWSEMMAFFYYKASRPSFLDKSAGQNQEKIPSLS